MLRCEAKPDLLLPACGLGDLSPTPSPIALLASYPVWAAITKPPGQQASVSPYGTVALNLPHAVTL